MEQLAERDRAVLSLERPHENLLVLYVVQSLAAFVFAPVVFLPLFFKYRTLRYRIDDEGISVSWGILFKQEIHLTYRRIQDIHVRRNLVERWLDIGTVQIQTASGSAEAEMSLVGVREYEAVRDFLYRRMRGLEAGGAAPAPALGGGEAPGAGAATGGGSVVREDVAEEEVVRLLAEIRAELVSVREAMESER